MLCVKDALIKILKSNFCFQVSVIAVLSMNMVTANMLLSVFFLSGVWADCPQQPAGLFITAPQKMEALNGSCLQIPCSFSAKAEQEFDSSREIFGVWIKSDSSLLTSYTNTYFFRIENKPFMATASCDPLQITVKDSPPSPRIEIPADLKEKQSVTITCSASTPCPHSPPKLTWNLQQDSHSNTEENTDRTFTTKIQETITLSDQHDGYNITCSARYPVNEGKDVKTAEERKTLSVSYAPKNTSVSISPSGLVSAGSWVNLTCSSRAKPPVSRFTWFKSSTDGPMTVSEGEVYIFKVTSVTDGGVYYCVATNDLGNQTSSQIYLKTADAPKNTSVSISPSGLVSAGSWVNLTCSSRAKPPVSRFTWFKNSTDGPKNVSVGEVYSFKVTSVTDGGVYYCVATNDLGNQTSSQIYLKTADAPKNTSVSISPSGLVSAGSWVNLTCSSRAKPPVSRFTWFKNSTDGPKNVSEGEVYSFKVTSVTDGGVYYCVATNDLGNETSSEIHLTVEVDVHSVQWQAVLGGIVGIIALICLVVCVWFLKSTHPTTQQTQSQTYEELPFQDPASKTEEKAEDIHYGEIDFSKRRRDWSSNSVQDSGQQQDTLYAQVKVSQPANSLTQTADGPEDLYAQVKKK
ncbi:B-cell receptor CD22-like isoform X3 [Micropterus salmoides]|uniref:B-cell receptor CD22-like isoform X3 n=1 Tax=Micropterus salmoides TaxID=27706 RepID=UPI0018EC419D|nr:B-cell receptor CD22-like isoform X3 [Micropterus salmoides]